MSVITSEKIFLDKKEEITFIVERVLNTTKERVILVVPQNSLVLSSLLSIKILYRKILNSTKVVIIVTEDEKGISMVQKANFVVVPKISNITEELWGIASERKDRDFYELENSKKEKIAEDTESVKAVKEDGVPLEQQKEEKIENVEKLVENDEDADKFKKPRREAKVINVAGIEIFAGGDIKKNKNIENNRDKIAEINDLTMSEIDRLKNISESKESFTGRDFTRAVTPAKKSIWSRLFSSKKRIKDPDERLEGAKPRVNRKRLLTILGITSLFLVVFLGYFVVFRFNSVDISLQVKKEDVSAAERVIGDTELQKIDYESYSIPSITVKEEALSTSRTGEATGEAKRGVKAKGAVTVFNTTSNPISLVTGTKITSVATSRVYVLLEDVSIEASKVDGNGAIEAKYSSDVSVEALEVGSEYNVSDSEPKTKFTIDGYESDKVYAQRFKEISGGTSESYTVVSEENVKSLKDKIVPDLKQEGLTKIKSFVPTGYILLEESVLFEEETVKPLPEVGAESKDKTFTLSVEAKITAFAVKSKDLEDISSVILGEEDSGKVVSNISEIKIANVKITDTKVSFDVSFKGTIGGTFTEDQIRQTLGGKSVKEARSYLSNQSDIENYSVSFSPGFLPDFLQVVPKDSKRIAVKLK
jgi:hypothetical protein